MPITPAITNKFKQKLLDGSHDSTDTFKMALYTEDATLGASTDAYIPTGEVASGNGYTTGGTTMTGFSGTLDGSTAVLTWADVSWPVATFTARGALIYNATDVTSVMVVDFGSNITSTNGEFKVAMPVADASTGLLRLA